MNDTVESLEIFIDSQYMDVTSTPRHDSEDTENTVPDEKQWGENPAQLMPSKPTDHNIRAKIKVEAVTLSGWKQCREEEKVQ